MSRTHISVVSRTHISVVSRAQISVVSRAQISVVSRAQVSVVSRAQISVVSRAQISVVPRVYCQFLKWVCQCAQDTNRVHAFEHGHFPIHFHSTTHFFRTISDSSQRSSCSVMPHLMFILMLVNWHPVSQRVVAPCPRLFQVVAVLLSGVETSRFQCSGERRKWSVACVAGGLLLEDWDRVT